MKKLVPFAGAALAAGLLVAAASDAPTYVGAGRCRDCHRTEKQGKQHPIWEASKHARSFDNLKAETAKNEAGESIPAQQSPVCLKCHAPLHGKAPELAAEGVACEVCHGPGSQYRKLSVMVDRKAAVKNGLTVYASQDAVKAMCLACHDNAHGIAFDFAKAWETVKHYRPAK